VGGGGGGQVGEGWEVEGGEGVGRGKRVVEIERGGESGVWGGGVEEGDEVGRDGKGEIG